MKCPECGQWNRASMPHCLRCGAPLNIDAASRLSWKEDLKESGSSPAYIRVDEYGHTDSTPDSRDILAEEMQDLKKRKAEGEARQRQLRQPRRTSGIAVQYVPAEQSPEASESSPEQTTTLRMKRISQEAEIQDMEAEIRHRVRYMDDNGSFVEPRSYDSWSDPSAEHHYAYSSSFSRKLPSRSARRKKALNMILSVFLIV